MKFTKQFSRIEGLEVVKKLQLTVAQIEQSRRTEWRRCVENRERDREREREEKSLKHQLLIQQEKSDFGKKNKSHSLNGSFSPERVLPLFHSSILRSATAPIMVHHSSQPSNPSVHSLWILYVLSTSFFLFLFSSSSSLHPLPVRNEGQAEEKHVSDSM